MNNTGEKQPRYCHSEDGEEFSGDFATREEAEAEGPGWTAECVPGVELLKVSPWRIEALMESIDEDFSERVGGDEPAIELTANDVAALAEIVRVFLVGHARFNRHGVKDVRRVMREDTGHG
jgi:hypothetical protein